MFRRSAACLIYLLACICLLPALTTLAQAASIGDPNTALYYLFELQRRFDKQCNGVAMPEAPTLQPSEILREIALNHAQTNTPVQQLLDENKIHYVSFLVLHTPEAPPKAAFNSLKGIQCPAMMGPYNEIGAELVNGLWWILMVERVNAPIVATQAANQANPSNPTGLTSPAVPVTPEQAASQNTKDTLIEGTQPPVIAGMQNGNSSAPVAASQKITDPNITPLQDQNVPMPNNAQGNMVYQLAQPNTAPAASPSPNIANALVNANAGNAANTGSSVQVAAPTLAATPIPVPQIPNPNPAAALNSAITGIPPTPVYTGTEKDTMFAAINQLRSRPNMCSNMEMPPAPALKKDAVLESAASKHTEDMAARKYLSTNTPEGVNIGQRVKDFGYKWDAIHTLLAQGYPTPEGALEGWMAKPSNCQSIMNSAFTSIGLGYSPQERIWTVIFASPIPEGALYITK